MLATRGLLPENRPLPLLHSSTSISTLPLHRGCASQSIPLSRYWISTPGDPIDITGRGARTVTICALCITSILWSSLSRLVPRSCHSEQLSSPVTQVTKLGLIDSCRNTINSKKNEIKPRQRTSREHTLKCLDLSTRGHHAI